MSNPLAGAVVVTPPYDLLTDAGESTFVRAYAFDAALPTGFSSAGTSTDVAALPVVALDTGAAAGAQRVRYLSELGLASPWLPWARRLDLACNVLVPSATYVAHADNEVGVGFGKLWGSLTARMGDGAATMYNAVQLFAKDGGNWYARYTIEGTAWETYVETDTGVPFALDTVYRLRIVSVPGVLLDFRINGVSVVRDDNTSNLPDYLAASTQANGFGHYVRCGAAAGSRVKAQFLGAWIRGAFA